MIEYLEKLIEDNEYQQALAYAEKLLLNNHNTARDIVAINCALLTARLWLGEYHGALVAGELAVQMSKDIQEWDYYGLSCVNLGVVHHRLRQYQRALDAWFTYLASVSLYRQALKYEATVWHNIAGVHTILGEESQSVKALSNALDATKRTQLDERYVNGIRQALIDAYLKAGDAMAIPRLMAKCDRFLRNNSGPDEMLTSRLWQWKLRTEFNILTNRHNKAMTMALRGINESQGKPRHSFLFHMLLGRINARLGNLRAALGHALAARVYAVQCRRYDFESEAAEFMYELGSGDAP